MFVSFSHRFLPFASNAGIFEGLSLPSLRRHCVAQFANRAEHYRQLARDLHFMARSLPPGERRSVLLEMAEE